MSRTGRPPKTIVTPRLGVIVSVRRPELYEMWKRGASEEELANKKAELTTISLQKHGVVVRAVPSRRSPADGKTKRRAR